MTEATSMSRRRVLGLEIPEALAFLLYCGIQLWMSLVHEPWGDEAQAWLLARDNSLPDLFYRRLHYEGTPGLWHLLLWVETRLHVSYLGMHWIAAALAAIGVYLFLRFAPLPRTLKLLFPFIFAIVYQGPVVARSYLLTLPLLAWLCVLRRRTPQRPVAYAVALGLLVNTSALSALLAIGLLLEWLYSASRERWRFPRAVLLRAAGATMLLWLVALYTILPAPDAHFGFLGGLSKKPAAARFLAKLTGTPVSTLAPVSETKPAPDATNQSEADPDRQVQRNGLQQKLYDLKFPKTKAGFGTHLLRNALLPLSFSLFAVSPSNLLGLAFYCALLLWLLKHRALRFALPFVLLAVIGPKLYISPHHAMVWWFALLGLIWSAWPSAAGPQRSRIDIAFNLLLAAVLVQQVVFGLHALYFDNRYPFDGGKAAEQFLVSNTHPGEVASFTFFPVSMQPYAKTNLFFNRPATYERWKRQDAIDMAIDTIETTHPRTIVLGESYTGTRNYDNQIIPVTPPGASLDTGEERRYVLSHGYHETHRFCGDQPIDLGTFERVCQVIYEPNTSNAGVR